MAVSTTTLAVRYTGNGSASTAYTVSFPFLDASHIYLSISEDGVEDAVLQSASTYTVTRNPDGSGGSLVTDEAVDSPAVLTIFRSTPLTQPLRLQSSGPLPAPSLELAYDRLLMQAQELASRIAELEGTDNPGVVTAPGGSSAAEVPTWATATARASVTPGRAGQLGVQRDNQTIWIAQSTTTGDWLEFRPRFTTRLILGLVSDAGTPGGAQDAVADLLTEWDVDAALFAGDNTYSGTGEYDNDWAAFDTLVAAGKAYPALGNHELDDTDFQTLLDAKFDYLPGNRRYYNVVLGDGLVELFVLNSGRNSAFDLVEADGNAVGSDQHDWFVVALAASTARWKIVMFHHPPASQVEDTSGRIEPEMAWPEFAAVDMICCGHAHLLEILKFDGVQLVNLSAATRADGGIGTEIQGGDTTDSVLFTDGTSYGIGRLIATQEALTVEVWSLGVGYAGGELLHTRNAHEFTLPVVATQSLVDSTGRTVAEAVAGSMRLKQNEDEATHAEFDLERSDGVMLRMTGMKSPESDQTYWSAFGMTINALYNSTTGLYTKDNEARSKVVLNNEYNWYNPTDDWYQDELNWAGNDRRILNMWVKSASEVTTVSSGSGVGGVTVTTSDDHNFEIGTAIYLEVPGTTPALAGSYTVVTVPTAKTFTITPAVAVTGVSTAARRGRVHATSGNSTVGKASYSVLAVLTVAVPEYDTTDSEKKVGNFEGYSSNTAVPVTMLLQNANSGNAASAVCLRMKGLGNTGGTWWDLSAGYDAISGAYVNGVELANRQGGGYGVRFRPKSGTASTTQMGLNVEVPTVDFDVRNGAVRHFSGTVSALNALHSASAAGAGARAMVTDATATTFASTVSGGGSNKVPVYSDGTNWLIG